MPETSQAQIIYNDEEVEYSAEDVARQQRAAETIRSKYRAVEISTSQMPQQRKLDDDLKQEAAGRFGARARSISMSKKLFDATEPAIKRVRAVMSHIDRVINDPFYVLPHPEPGIRLLIEAKIDEFDQKLWKCKEDLAAAAEALWEELPMIRERQRHKLGQLFKASDYEFDPRRSFRLEWHYTSRELPDYLSRLNPRIVERERQAVQAEFMRAVRIKEQELEDSLLEAINHLAERISADEEAEGRKVFRNSTVEAVVTAIDEAERQFAANNIGSPKLKATIGTLKQHLQGHSAEGLAHNLRESEGFRESLAKQLTAISESIVDLRVRPKRRSIIRE